MDIKKIKKRITKEIKKGKYSYPDSKSWEYKEGVLLSYKEAQLILDLLSKKRC